MTFVTNTGGAWSQLQGHTRFLGLMAAAVCVARLVDGQRRWPRPLGLSLALELLLGRVAGNMFARLLAKRAERLGHGSETVA